MIQCVKGDGEPMWNDMWDLGPLMETSEGNEMWSVSWSAMLPVRIKDKPHVDPTASQIDGEMNEILREMGGLAPL